MIDKSSTKYWSVNTFKKYLLKIYLNQVIGADFQVVMIIFNKYLSYDENNVALARINLLSLYHTKQVRYLSIMETYNIKLVALEYFNPIMKKTIKEEIENICINHFDNIKDAVNFAKRNTKIKLLGNELVVYVNGNLYQSNH